MNKTTHAIFIMIMILITLLTLVWFSFSGYSYYNTELTERFYHDQHELFKSSGEIGHGIGILGTLLILIGVFGYMARKRYRFLSRFGLLKYWLEVHIFLCTEGAILILFHTSFKFGGLVSISFWSMVAVVLSGIIGRFIYIQIPRTIEGRMLSLNEVIKLKDEQFTSKPTEMQQFDIENTKIENQILAIRSEIQNSSGILLSSYFKRLKQLSGFKRFLISHQISKTERKVHLEKLKTELSLSEKIKRLESMQQLFKYWHVAHLPFALIMLIIAVIHVGITLIFGYKWIF